MIPFKKFYLFIICIFILIQFSVAQMQYAPTPSISKVGNFNTSLHDAWHTFSSARTPSVDELLSLQKELRHEVYNQRKSRQQYFASHVKGNALEDTIVSNYSRLEKLNGYKNISSSLKYNGNNGTDGFFYEIDKNGRYNIKIVEVKTGRASLSESSGFVEMSNEWIIDRIEKSIKNLERKKGDPEELKILKDIRESIQNGNADIERILTRVNIENGNLKISNYKIQDLFKSSGQLRGKGDSDFVLKSEHEIPLSRKTKLTHGKQKLQDDVYENLYNRLTNGSQKTSKRKARRVLAEIEKNSSISSNLELRNSDSLENVLEKQTRTSKLKMKLKIATIPEKNVKILYKIGKAIPYMGIAIEMVSDVKDILSVRKSYYNAKINKRTLLIRSVGVAGGIAGGAAGGLVGEKIGAFIGIAIGSLINPGAGSTIGGAIGGFIGSSVGGIGGYMLGNKLAENLVDMATVKFFPTIQSDYYFELLCKNLECTF